MVSVSQYFRPCQYNLLDIFQDSFTYVRWPIPRVRVIQVGNRYAKRIISVQGDMLSVLIIDNYLIYVVYRVSNYYL